ncbi:MAG: PAS domain S-box protein, partial [Actinobacteria bacterium]|nr:PAS domain S-box protein [Actinomycetota bacterium]
LRLRAEVESRTARMTEMNDRLARDLQSLRTAEETMRLSEERFRHLWEGSPLAAIGTQSSVITFANNAAAQLFGYANADRIVGLAEVDLAARTERPEIASRIRNRLKGVEEPSSYETRGAKADGTEFPMRVDVVVIEQGAGSVVITFFTDMTERVRAEEALRDSASQYRALFENSPVSLWEQDFSEARKILAKLDVPLDELQDYLLDNPEVLAKAAAGMVVHRVNRTTLELWHARSEADLTGGLDPYVVDANQELYALELVAIARGEQRFFGMAEIPTLDEHMMFANIYWTVAPGHEATYGKVFVSIIDLSDQRRMQLQLMRYKDSLEVLVEERTTELSQANTSLLEATKAKDKFLAAMSHELRTPLNSIIGFSGTMLQRLAGEINEEQERQLTLVQRSGRHLLMLINQVLDLSRIEAGQEHFEPEEFAVGPFVEELVDDVSGLAQDKGIAVKSDITAAPESIVSDRDRLKQILLNLLSNGIKFTEEGEVSLSASVQGELIVFRVRDSGPGIPFDEQGNVFEAFHQIRTSAGHKPPGTGLGLSISRELATLLGGEISLESEPGNGSVFIVRIPRDAASEPLPGNTSSTVVAGSGDSRGPDVT